MEQVPTNPTSPNEIPPRTSSVGIAHSQRGSRALRPLAEDSWLGNSAAATAKSNSHAKMSRKPSNPQELAENDNFKEQNEVRAEGIGSDLIFPSRTPPRTWSPEKEKILFGPYDYLYGTPGKDIRSQMISAFNAWLKVPAESLSIITRVVGMLHTSSLLVDDVEDSSVLRRGQPVAHSIFGTAQTINSANYVYFCALQELQKLNNPKAIEIYTEELLNLHRGQGMDLFWRDTLTCPSEEDYLEMVNNKTGGLFRLAVKLMQAESSADVDCVPLVNTIGLLFQILDDYNNLSSTTYTVNKGLAEDLTEGKFSFPIVHAIRTSPAQSLVLTNILKQRTNDDEVKRYAIGYLERAGSFEYTRKVLRELTERAFELIDGMDSTGEENAAPSAGLGTGVRLIIEKLKIDENSKDRSP